MFDWLSLSQTMKLAALVLVVPLAGIALTSSQASRVAAATADITTAAAGGPASAGVSAGATAAAAAGAGAGVVPSPEDAAVRVALNAYLDGHATGQADAFRRAFHPDARMLFMREGHFVKTEIADYIARAPGKAAADEDRRRRTIDLVDIVGDAAIAKITLDYPEVTFTDYMTLLKIDGEWRIVSKVFHADRKDRKS